MTQTTLTYFDPNQATTVVSGIINHFLDDQNFSHIQRYQLMRIKPDIKIIVRRTVKPKPSQTTLPSPPPSSSPTPFDSPNTPPRDTTTTPTLPPPVYRYEYIHRGIPIRLAVTLFENYEMVVDETDGLIMYLTLPDTITGQAVAEMLVWVMALVQSGKVPGLYSCWDVKELKELRSAAQQMDVGELVVVAEMRLRELAAYSVES